MIFVSFSPEMECPVISIGTVPCCNTHYGIQESADRFALPSEGLAVSCHISGPRVGGGTARGVAPFLIRYKVYCPDLFFCPRPEIPPLATVRLAQISSGL